MALILDSDCTLVRDSAMAFFSEKAPIGAFRKLRDDPARAGYSGTLWNEMAELGWLGFLVSESYGGSSFGMMGLGQVMEAGGRTLAVSPLLSNGVLAPSILERGGSDAHKADLLPELVEGRQLFALALDERAHHAPYDIATTASRVDGGFRIDGAKSFVIDGSIARNLIVVARTAGVRTARTGLSLFLVPAETPGVHRQRLSMVDSRDAAQITFTGVLVDHEALLGTFDRGADLIQFALDRARAALAAEMLGSMSETFERTIQYLKDRKQFDVPIGSFQALKHRAALMFCEIELTRSAVMAALAALDEAAPDAAQLVSLAKAKAGEAFELISCEAVQMHGGIGMTDEFDIGLFLKRARVAQATFGDAPFHRDRYASLEGF